MTKLQKQQMYTRLYLVLGGEETDKRKERKREVERTPRLDPWAEALGTCFFGNGKEGEGANAKEESTKSPSVCFPFTV